MSYTVTVKYEGEKILLRTVAERNSVSYQTLYYWWNTKCGRALKLSKADIDRFKADLRKPPTRTVIYAEKEYTYEALFALTGVSKGAISKRVQKYGRVLTHDLLFPPNSLRMKAEKKVSPDKKVEEGSLPSEAPRKREKVAPYIECEVSELMRGFAEQKYFPNAGDAGFSKFQQGGSGVAIAHTTLPATEVR